MNTALREQLRALEARGAKIITALAHEANPGAGRVLERLGFERLPSIAPPHPDFCVYLKAVL